MANSSFIYALETAINKVVNVAVAATSGTWTFSINGSEATSALAYNVSGVDATTAAVALAGVESGDVVITGGPGGSGGSTPYVFTFGGAMAGSDAPVVTTNAASLAGSTHTAAVTVATHGAAAWGTTPSTGWREIPVLSDGAKTRVKPLGFVGISSDSGSAATDEFFRQVVEGGDVVVDAPGISNGLGVLMATTCDSATSTVHEGGTLAFDQVFTWGPAGPPIGACVSGAMRRLRKGTSTLDEFLHPGCRATQLDVGCSVDGNLSLKFTLDSKPPVLAASLPERTIAAVAPDLLYAWSDATITINGDPVCATDFSLVLPTGNDVDDKCMSKGDTRHIPMRKGRPALTGSLNWLYTNPVYYNAWINGTILPLTATWVGPVVIEGSTYPSLSINVEGIRFTGDDPVVSVDDPTKQSLPFEIIVNSTHDLTMTFVTSDTGL